MGVAASGSTIVVGAYGNDDAGSKSGSAYVFDATSGTQLFKLTASDAAADDYFGGAAPTPNHSRVLGH